MLLQRDQQSMNFNLTDQEKPIFKCCSSKFAHLKNIVWILAVNTNSQASCICSYSVIHHAGNPVNFHVVTLPAGLFHIYCRLWTKQLLSAQNLLKNTHLPCNLSSGEVSGNLFSKFWLCSNIICNSITLQGGKKPKNAEFLAFVETQGLNR